METSSLSTPTYASALPKNGRFTLESRPKEEEEGLGSPVDNSPVSRIGRFAVVGGTRESEIQDVIRRNIQQANNTRVSPQSQAVQDSLVSLTSHISNLIERNTYLEAENQRLARELHNVRYRTTTSVQSDNSNKAIEQPSKPDQQSIDQ